MHRYVFIAAALSFAILTVDDAVASSETRSKFLALAQRILSETKNAAVSVGVFSQTGLNDSNAGPGLEQILTEELNRIIPGIVREDAKFVLKGDYAFAKTRNPADEGRKVIKITVRLIEKEFAEEVVRIPLHVQLGHTKTIAEILQVTASLPAKGSKAERQRRLDDANENPQVTIHGAGDTLVSSSPDSPYAVQLLVKPLKNHEHHHAQPRKAEDVKGLAFVDIQENELYEVKVYNNSDRPVAVTLSIDGLNEFHFTKDRNSVGEPVYTHHILGPNSSTTIVGWHNTIEGTENSLSFLVTGYGQGAVTKAGIQSRGQVGVIHVQFAHCQELKEGQRPRSGNETGFGPSREVQQKVVRFEIEPPHDFVSIRYNRP